MAHIYLATFIRAPLQRVFDLSRSIGLHEISTSSTNEKAIAGVVNGLINKNETVTWQAKHLFKTRQFTSKIIEMEPPIFFKDQMIKGDFKSFVHQHQFNKLNNGTNMIDMVDFDSPYGILGKVAEKFCLKNYMKKVLINRNKIIKEYAETEKWEAILK